MGGSVHAIVLAPAFVATSDTGGTVLGIGNVATIKVNVDETVFVTGTPALLLNNNEVATYTGGSGTSQLTFSYTVQSGDDTAGPAGDWAQPQWRHHQGRGRR